jgi:putative hemolysin
MTWLVVMLCGLVSFVFAGLEAGLLSVNRVRLQHYARQKDRAALKIEKLLRRPERVLVTILLVTNLLNIFAIVISTSEIVRRIGSAGYVVSFALWLPLNLFILQLLPKSLFRRFPYRALAAFAEVLRMSELILSPAVAVGSTVAALIYPREKREQRKAFVAREDVKYFMTQSEQVGTLTKTERAMIDNIVDFRSVNAADVMVAMKNAQTIRAEAPVEELFRVSREKNLDRLPVMSSAGAVTGLVNVFDVVTEARPIGKAVRVYQRRILTVLPDEPAYNVIRKLRAARTGLAVVADRTGKPVGIVSAADLVRRLVMVAGVGRQPAST